MIPIESELKMKAPVVIDRCFFYALGHIISDCLIQSLKLKGVIHNYLIDHNEKQLF